MPVYNSVSERRGRTERGRQMTPWWHPQIKGFHSSNVTFNRDIKAGYTLGIWRLLSCCCHRRMVSNRQIQILMFPTSTDFPTPRINMHSAELSSWRRSLIRRGLYWSSRTSSGNLETHVRILAFLLHFTFILKSWKADPLSFYNLKGNSQELLPQQINAYGRTKDLGFPAWWPCSHNMASWTIA